MLQQLYNSNPPRCECHQCTQARHAQSFQGQSQGAMGTTGQQAFGGSQEALKQQQMEQYGHGIGGKAL